MKVAGVNIFKEIFLKILKIFLVYDQKLQKAKMSTGMNEAVICGIGQIDHQKVVLCIMDSRFMMGSMGKVVGEKICKGVELAIRKKLPLIISCTSGGARMQEGIDSLMQMAKVSSALKIFKSWRLLYHSTNSSNNGWCKCKFCYARGYYYC